MLYIHFSPKSTPKTFAPSARKSNNIKRSIHHFFSVCVALSAAGENFYNFGMLIKQNPFVKWTPQADLERLGYRFVVQNK